jgi:hypothetical protein
LLIPRQEARERASVASQQLRKTGEPLVVAQYVLGRSGGDREGCACRRVRAGGGLMRRSRALVVFGALVAVLAVGTARAKPLSLARAHAGQAGSSLVLPRASSELELGSGLLGYDVAFRREHEDRAVFGALVRPGRQPDTAAAEGACGPDMVEVDGDYCPLVPQTCLRWLDPETKLQCAEFEQPTAAVGCALKTQHKRFCIDRYEWPNRVRALPRIMVSYGEAKASCESVGKRLCSDTEWTLAC